MEYKYVVPLEEWEMDLVTTLLSELKDGISETSEDLLTADPATINSENVEYQVYLLDGLVQKLNAAKEFFDTHEIQKDNLEKEED